MTPVKTVRVTYDCGHEVRELPGRVFEDCPTCANGVPEGAEYCEDYPACGHTDGDGCGFDPRHTSDYWSEFIRRREAEGFDIDDPDFYPDDYY